MPSNSLKRYGDGPLRAPVHKNKTYLGRGEKFTLTLLSFKAYHIIKIIA